jgi:hypothetical protein
MCFDLALCYDYARGHFSVLITASGASGAVRSSSVLLWCSHFPAQVPHQYSMYRPHRTEILCTLSSTLLHGTAAAVSIKKESKEEPRKASGAHA